MLAGPLAVGACDQIPTGPESYRQIAGGEEWVAIAAPAGLPPAGWMQGQQAGMGRVEPRVLLNGLSALDRWTTRVALEADLEASPALAISHGRVVEARRLATEALAAGDTSAAMLRIQEAAEVIRGHAPPAVALRVLERTEAVLEAKPEGTPGVARALRLLRSARAELEAGEGLPALRRALYALQLAEGKGLRAAGAAAPDACAGAGCRP